MNPLIFVDTNIMLDFYRVRGREGGLAILDHIDANRGRIITSPQVEMEYKKNRQGAILDALKALKAVDWGPLTLPALLGDSRPKKNIEKSRNVIETQRKSALTRIEKLLRDPARTDPVYKVLQRLFRADSEFNLANDEQALRTVQRAALKRFLLGYPPRKSGDTSYGDAVNWEWIITCAQRSTTEVIIVSRDSDYGAMQKDESFLNDWLGEEFRRRVSKKRSIVLTTRLTDAFKRSKIVVTRKEEEAEQTVIEERRTAQASTDKREDLAVEEVLRRLQALAGARFLEPRL